MHAVIANTSLTLPWQDGLGHCCALYGLTKLRIYNIWLVQCAWERRMVGIEKRFRPVQSWKAIGPPAGYHRYAFVSVFVVFFFVSLQKTNPV